MAQDIFKAVGMPGIPRPRISTSFVTKPKVAAPVVAAPPKIGAGQLRPTGKIAGGRPGATAPRIPKPAMPKVGTARKSDVDKSMPSAVRRYSMHHGPDPAWEKRLGYGKKAQKKVEAAFTARTGMKKIPKKAKLEAGQAAGLVRPMVESIGDAAGPQASYWVSRQIRAEEGHTAARKIAGGRKDPSEHIAIGRELRNYERSRGFRA